MAAWTRVILIDVEALSGASPVNALCGDLLNDCKEFSEV